MDSSVGPTVTSVGVPPRATRELSRGTYVGRYLLLDLLGEGGMGAVYKAYDPELGRPVALKLLQAEDDPGAPGNDPHSAGSHHELRDRLLREAQALARLSHPNVISVHDVGTFRNQVFIAMEFVEGRNLREWLKAQPRTRREILDVFLAAGEGLAAAHRAGLIHRDFKPDNVMLGDDRRVRVLDFGLARAANETSLDRARATSDAEPPPKRAERDRDGIITTAEPPSRSAGTLLHATPPASTSTPQLLETPLTRAGAIMGTPRYMAPEQALDGAVDEAADQYSFCVSLYWALYGQFPFDGIESAVEGKFSDPPAESTVPRWLRQVLERGLSVTPADRHSSMVTLLEALRADPAEVRRRRLRGAMGAVSAIALASAVVAGALAYKARSGAAKQSQVAQEFGQEVAQISSIARYAAFMPLHDVRRENDAIRARMAGLRERMIGLGPLAAGPGHYALGHGDLALEDYDEALRELDAAWATGYRSSELAYALGLVHGQMYQRALAALRKSDDAALDAKRRDEIVRLHRDPALHYLKQVGSQAAEAKNIGGVDAPEYVEGLIALYEQRFDDALTLARKAFARIPWLFEARTLEGDVHYLRGKELNLKGDVDGATEEYGRAGEAYRAALEIAHSSEAALMGECSELSQVARLEANRDQSPEATVRRAVAACGAAATARPDSASPLGTEATALTWLAQYQGGHGIDRTAADEEAIELGEKAIRIDPREVNAHYAAGLAARDLGAYRMEKGEDPRALFARAIEHGQRQLDIDSSDVAAYSLLSLTYAARGDYESGSGIDPRESLQRAMKYAEELSRLSPEFFGAWDTIGMSLWSTGRWERDHGSDATASFESAERVLEKVVQLGPKIAYGYLDLCFLYGDWGAADRRRGADPKRRFAQGLEQCQRAIEINPDSSYANNDLGWILVSQARSRLDEKLDPTDPLASARSALERALKIDRKDSFAHATLADALVVEAQWTATSGHDPERAFGEAESNGKAAVALSGGKDLDAMHSLAEVYRRRAEWRAGRRMSVTADVREGLALTARALAQNPSYADAAETEGALHLATARGATGAARMDAAGRAKEALQSALRINANLEHELRPLLDEAARLGAS